jgi:hypothetical protein
MQEKKNMYRNSDPLLDAREKRKTWELGLNFGCKTKKRNVQELEPSFGCKTK